MKSKFEVELKQIIKPAMRKLIVEELKNNKINPVICSNTYDRTTDSHKQRQSYFFETYQFTFK